MNKIFDQNRIRQFFFILIILLLGILLFRQLQTFLPALLGAITLYVLLHKWMFYLTEKKRWRKGWTAILLMLFSFIVILLPVGLLVNMLSSKVSYAIQHSAELTEALNGAGDTKTPTWINFIGFWLFQIPLGYVLAKTLELGPLGAFIAIPVAESAIALAAWYYFKKGKWKEVKV